MLTASHRVTQKTTTSSSLAARAFGGRIPLIQFLGPRNKLNKSIGAYASAASSSHAATDSSTSHADKKALSLDCELAFADIPADRWARLEFSEQEVEVINAGTNEVTMDWRNIRL